MLHAWSRRLLGLVLGLAAVAFVPRALEAQTGKITGVVTDQSTGQPVEGVQIFLQGTGFGSVSNANGRYFLLSVPPGSYTVVARRIGYAEQARPDVQVLIDVTRELNFALSSSSTVLQREVIRADQVPLIQPGQTTSGRNLTGQEIQNLPVTSIEQALSLQQGFVAVPNSTDLISFAESRRTAVNPIRIRGGRGGETLMLIDGIPVNNFIFGGPALRLAPSAVEQLDFVKGGMEPQYGNALSGVINIATREGGTNLAGRLNYTTGRVGDALGNDADALRGYNLVEGFVSGPVPGVGERLSFVLSGREERQADAVYEYDDDIFVPSQRGTNTSGWFSGEPNLRDVFPGLRGFGFNNQRQMFGKLTFRFTPTMKLNVTVLDNENQRKPFDPQYQSTYGNVLESPGARTPEDSAVFIGNLTGYRLGPLDFQRVVQSSINASQRLYVARLAHTLNRVSYNIAAGAFRTRRTTCNYFEGVCLEDNFGDPNFTDDQQIGPLSGTCSIHPTCGTDAHFGGERLNTAVLRGDLQSQVTDHHNIQGGILYQRYDLGVNVAENVGTNNINIYRQQYSSKPWDFATYIQDRIEYDFLTIKLGARFDYGKVPGSFFADPLDPTNGTTAADVCADPSRFQNVRSAETREVESADPTWTPASCASDSVRMLARSIASHDDFRSAKARKQFSPRIGVSFPLSQSSAVFFNFGRYSQNPLLNSLLTNTGIGTSNEGTIAGPVIDVPGEGGPGYLGNPNLEIERSTTYEMGYQAEFRTNYALQVNLFNKNQTGLTGIRTGGVRLGPRGYEQVFDPGVTYGGSDNTPSYNILVNQDFQSVRGFEVSLRRRVANYFGFDINYSFSRARTNASEPDREFERQVNQGDPRNLFETTSDIDQPHVFNATLVGQVGAQAPSFRYGWLLKHSTASITVQTASGLPYTPSINFTGIGAASKLLRNTGRAPSTSQVNMLLQKGFSLSNLRYDAFLQVSNLFNRRNCVTVFVTTGTCEAGAPDQARARQGNAINLGADVLTSSFLDRADYYAEPRAILGGIKVNF